ncbi:MAG: pyruvate dehydrogenase (acetyl-transferring), homodimeric type [Deltaproteobacteria bacterium]|nr:pyruvate dehydrogenase (acetyl-transferring), homodimeric type [Deltaproteobacteria bacterium]
MAVEIGQDVDPLETREWLESLESVLEREGPERALFLLERLAEHARRKGSPLPFDKNTPYFNTIPPHQEPLLPGDPALEERILSFIRWNAMAMVVRANKEFDGVGGHIATYASAANLYEMGFNHFWRAATEKQGADLVYIQGHSSPGIYARAFLEGRLTEDNLWRFRREVEPGGLSSYPHPWLMPDFWQFAVVSMGLGPLMAMYQARFMKYLDRRGLIEAGDRRVWAFLGDGETDEPESLGALTFAAREQLDNLVFVVNCNLQRLDGPVRGNGKIVQELEGAFRGAGWNVIKVLWGSAWDPLFARDTSGHLARRLNELVDGQFQSISSNGGAKLRELVFSTSPELEALAAGLSDDDLDRLAIAYGGHDPQKVHAAFSAANAHQGGPTVILAKTIKGYGMGSAGHAQMSAHQTKKLDEDSVRVFRDSFQVPLSDDEVAKIPFFRPSEESPEVRYLKSRRESLGGPLPSRSTESPKLEIPPLEAFQALLTSSGEREISTTMAFVRALAALIRNKEIKDHLVPILADEARTFGMEGMFRQLGIYSVVGQKYKPVDADQLMYYREEPDGQILQEGITEAGALASWIAAATSYSNHGVPMIPFFIFYSMFGFQRIGDLAWAAGDMQARGFLLGATSGRTTLNGEGLQHEDGHSHILASTFPNCVAYDPTYAYEVAVILQDGLRRMYVDQENVFYYLTLLNENYPHGELPKGIEEAILKGMYRLRASKSRAKKKRVQLLGSGAILREVEAAAEILAADFGIAADVWSVTSFTELRRDGMATDRWNRMNPTKKAKASYVSQCLAKAPGPVVAATDYMKAFGDQIRAWVPNAYTVLGTDGFGRSDTRSELRRFFEVDRYYVTLAALKALADEGEIPATTVTKAMKKFGIQADKADPVSV